MIRKSENNISISQALPSHNILLLCVVLFCLSLLIPVCKANSTNPKLVALSDNHQPILTISGLIGSAQSIQFSYSELRKLPHHHVRTSTVVTDGVIHFEGVLLRDLLASVGAKGKIVEALALNGYAIDIPVKDADQYDVLVAWAANSTLLDPKDKGPLWIIYPRDQFKILQDMRYDYRWVWQLKQLTVR